MHRLLQRQIKRHLGHLSTLPKEWESFLAAVDKAYGQFDDDHAMIERSLELSSSELLQANTQLQGLLNDVEAQVADRTVELAKTNTELKQTLANLQNAQAQLIQAEKMSSLGQLVAGIAHEINNPINFIHGNLIHLGHYASSLLAFAQLFRQDSSLSTIELQQQAEDIDVEYIQHDLPKLLSSMESGTRRIKEIVLSLRNFSRLDESHYKSVNIHEGIESTLMILESRLSAQPDRPEIKIIRDYGSLPLVECCAGELNQVFMNLLLNAIDAINERDRRRSKADNIHGSGWIWITTEVTADQHIRIEFSNNGPDITPEVRSRLFDPFFTTKPVGKGTGMGLAISYHIITDRHQGTIECVAPEMGEGTKFLIKIPMRQQMNDRGL